MVQNYDCLYPTINIFPMSNTLKMHLKTWYVPLALATFNKGVHRENIW